MTSPLAGSLAKTIGNAMASRFLDAVLTRDVPNVGADPADPVPPTPTQYPCKAIVEAYSQYLRANGLVGANDRKVLILANSLGLRPKAGDRVTIKGITFRVIEVGTDPAEAVWECKGQM